VVFTDGTRERVDLVVFATGYDMAIPYVPQHYLSWTNGRPDMYLNAFAARPGLFGVSYLEVNSSAYTLFDRVANLVACHLADLRDDPARAERLRQLVISDHPDLSGGVHFVDSPRHTNYVEVRAYRQNLRRVARSMGWPELKPGRFDAIRMSGAHV